MNKQNQFATEYTETTEKNGGANPMFAESANFPAFLCVLCDLCGLNWGFE
jgi:hypothetical protein